MKQLIVDLFAKIHALPSEENPYIEEEELPEGYMECQECGEPTWNIEYGQCSECGFSD